jgi:Sulfatase
VAQVRSRKRANERRLEGMIADDVNLMKQARDTLKDERVHFVFIHMPVPHPPGVYDRRTQRMCACGNYLDNLKLADDTLGALMREIDQTSRGAPTTVVLSSDHSWRVSLWKANADWTPEEEAVSQGRFDPRPVFMVHFPGQTSGREVLAPLPELVEYDVIAGMLEGKIRGPQDIEALVQSPREVASLTQR